MLRISLQFFAHKKGVGCKGCELCTTACPKQIVAIQHEKRNKEGVFTAYCTDDDACIGCAMCAMMCPDCAIVIES